MGAYWLLHTKKKKYKKHFDLLNILQLFNITLKNRERCQMF